MPKYPRTQTNYPGVCFIQGKALDGRPENIFYINYYRNGKRVEEKAGRQFRDKMTAARANQIRTRRLEGDLPSNQERREAAQQQRWTLDRLWEEYCEPLAQKTKSFVTDRGRYQNFIRPALGQKEPRELSPLDVHRLQRTVAQTHAPQTVKHVLLLLQRLVNFGFKRGLCPGINFKIDKPRVDNKKTEFLTPEQIKALTQALDAFAWDPQAANFMRLALYTGMRRGEIFKLQWRDVDFDRGFITLREPKGGQAETIPLNQAVRELLEDHPRDPASPFVFPGRGGRQRTRPPKGIQDIRKLAGLPPDFRPLHGLRHSYASMLASSGQVDLYVLQKLLTHKSAAMTQRYAHLRDTTLKRASDLAGELIDQAANGKEAQVVNLEDRKD